jgi:23S rRNA maturation-related 3'-5' exoribonuclease YhaM
MKTCRTCNLAKEDKDLCFSKKTGKLLKRCISCWKQHRKEYTQANVEKENALKKKWAENNSEKVKAARKKWKNNNIGKVKADKARRKEYVKKATPKWLSPFQLEVIETIYMMAELRTKMFGIKYNVDHIIPLRGENVCGLNVPWNLETITEEENLKKGNKLLPWRTNG